MGGVMFKLFVSDQATALFSVLEKLAQGDWDAKVPAEVVTEELRRINVAVANEKVQHSRILGAHPNRVWSTGRVADAVTELEDAGMLVRTMYNNHPAVALIRPELHGGRALKFDDRLPAKIDI